MVFFPWVLQLADKFEVPLGSRYDIATAADNDGDGCFDCLACVHPGPRPCMHRVGFGCFTSQDSWQKAPLLQAKSLIHLVGSAMHASRLLGCEVTGPIQIGEQSWLGGLPTQLVTGQIAGGRIVRGGEGAEITELFRRFLRRY